MASQRVLPELVGAWHLSYNSETEVSTFFTIVINDVLHFCSQYTKNSHLQREFKHQTSGVPVKRVKSCVEKKNESC